VRSYDAEAVAAFGPAGAVQAVVAALRGGLDPAADPPRIPGDLVGVSSC